jgi:SulP family sulfate permease
VLIHRFEAELIFANAELFQEDVLARVHAAERRPATVILDFEGVGFVDVTGAESLRSVYDTLEGLGIRLIVARARSSVRRALDRAGLAQALGEENLLPTVDRAVEACAGVALPA